MGVSEFRLPDVGEGLTEAEIVAWHVAPGDVVSVNQVLVEIETAKSVVELPSPFAGRVAAVLVEEGQTVAVGTPIVSVAVDDPGHHGEEPSPDQAEPSPGMAADRQQVLVGYGPAAETAPRRRSRRRRRVGQTTDSPGAGRRPGRPSLQDAFGTYRDVPRRVAPPGPPTPLVPSSRGPHADSAASSHGAGLGDALPNPGELSVQQVPTPPSEQRRARARPPVRHLAATLGVDLSQIPGTGGDGTVTRQDVLQAASAAGVSARDPLPGSPRVKRVPVTSVRRATAAAVSASAREVPRAMVWRSVDVTPAMALLDTLRREEPDDAARLTLLTLVAKASFLAIARTPPVNAAWGAATSGVDVDVIQQRSFINLGVATATSRGLLLPVVHDADQLDLRQLARRIRDVVVLAREGTATPADLAGATFSITNVGVFGADGGLALLPAGTAAILSLGAARRRPWVVRHEGEERIRPRAVVTLALTFDHRVLDGEEASVFIGTLADVLQCPARALTF